MTDPVDRPEWRGRTNVDALTIAALEYAEQLAGKTFTVTQGSYNTSVSASAGTHAGGGAVDLRWTWDHADIVALRRAGFAAWHRTPDQGGWPHHIHAVLVDHPKLSPAAARQVEAYRAGRNGLANNGPDDGPRINPIPVYRWGQNQEDDMPTAEDLWNHKDPKTGLTMLQLQRRAAKSLDATRNHNKRNRELLREILATKTGTSIPDDLAGEILDELAERLTDDE